MTMRRFLATATFLSAMATVGGARADDAAMAEAQARFKEGLELADASKFDEARLKFLQASAVLKAPAVLFNLATAEQKTGHEVEAVDHYRAFLKGSVNDTRINDAMREKAKQNIAALLPKVAQLDIEVAPGAKVSVDGKPLDETPTEPIAVTAGKHTVEATLNGTARSVRVDAVVGQVTKAKVDLEATSTPAKPTTEGGERTTAGWVVPIGLGVLGLGGVVMGAAFASASNSSKEELDRLGTPGVCAPPGGGTACTAYEDKGSTMNTQTTLSWVGYGVGGVALAAAVVTFIVWPKSAKASPTTGGINLVPMVDAHHAGANLGLRF